ncbi:MAG: hypothetical protein RLZZ387_5620 [Chloroflexota bacterium]
MSQVIQRGQARINARPLVRSIAVLLGLLSPLAAALLGGSLARLAALLSYPYPHDGLEGTLLHEARMLRTGEQIYGQLEPHHFVSAPYPPLHPIVLALADTYAGPHVFWSGRVVSLACALLTAALVALVVRRAAGSGAAGLIGAALFLSAPPVLLWGTRVKPDLMALSFTALGLLLATVAIRGGERPRGAAWRHGASGLAAVCFACAFFTKQTDVAAALAAGLALAADDLLAWREGRLALTPLAPIRPRTAAFALIYLTLALSGWALLDIATGGGYTLHVWWNFQRTSWWSPGLFRKIATLLTFWWPAMILAALAVALAPRRRALLAPALYALVSPLTLLLAGEVGANHNHLLESHLALAMAGGCALGWAAGAAARGRPVALAAVALAGLQLVLAFGPPGWYADQLAPEDPPERFVAFIRATPGEVLADDTGLLMAAGKPLRYDDPSTMGPAARSGLWDQRGLVEEIAQRRFAAIMLPLEVEESLEDPAERWTPEVLAAVRQHYRLLYRDRISTYVPR